MALYKLDAELDRSLGELADSNQLAKRATTKPEVIRRAVALYTYLHQRANAEGLRVAFVNATDEIVAVIDPLP